MFGERLRRLREEKGWTRRELAERADISLSAIAMYERSERRPAGDLLIRLARALDVSPEYLLGVSDDATPGSGNSPLMEGPSHVQGTVQSRHGENQKPHEQKDRVRRVVRAIFGPMNLRMLPVVGVIAAGYPLLAEENIVDYLAVPDELADQADFVLKVTGDSMVGAGIYDGDYVLMKKVDGSEIKSGDIVAALVNGESTLKFLQYRDGKWYLEPANPNYPPIPIDDDVEVQVQAKFVALYTKRIRLNRPRGDAAQALDNVSDEDLIQALAERRGLDPEVVKAILMALRKGK